jgi:DNA-binding NtrC family response regulator
MSNNYISQYYHSMRTQPFEVLNGAVVVLVEPEPETRAFYTQQLADIGIQVHQADALNNMLSVVEAASPDVVIVNPSTDLENGFKFIKILKKEYADLPVITMTMTMREDQLDAIMEAGVSMHINRGLTRPRDLLLALEQVIPKR